MDGIQFVLEAIKTFGAVKNGLDGMNAGAALLATGVNGSVYVIQKGAKFISYLITKSKAKKPAKVKSPARSKKTAPKTSSQELAITKQDVAVVVDISRRALVDVGKFLDEQKIDADIVMVTNDPAYGPDVIFLNPESNEEWIETTLEFKSLMNKIKRAAGGRNVHIFLAAPAPLVFAMGAVWGTVDEASVYHWEHNTYHKVIEISRKLR